MKQHISLGQHGGRIVWDNEHPYRCAIIQHSTGIVRWLDYCWDVDVSYESSRAVAVIDTNSILNTPVARQLVPPPMSLYECKTPAPVNLVVMKESAGFEQQAIEAVDDANSRMHLASQQRQRPKQVLATTTTPMALLLSDLRLIVCLSTEQQHKTKPSAILDLHHEV